MFLQKGVGRHIRGRLKRNGVDLDNQGINQALAGLALKLNLATLDLRGASDAVSTELVAQLVPVDWFNYMDDLRSHYGLLDGQEIRFEKFSSMGNGFTFELESLIFFALGYAIVEVDSVDIHQHAIPSFSVYGDDLICPVEMSQSFIEVLSYCGFEINPSKSFVTGYFFESCGKHFFKSCEVTPIYQKEVLDDRESIRFFNRYLRWCMKYSEKSEFLSILRERSIFRNLSIPLHEESDDGFLTVIDSSKATAKGYVRIKVVKQVHKAFPANESAFYAYALRKLHARSPLMRAYDPYRSRLSDLLLLDATDGRQVVEVESGRFIIGYRNSFL
jgi:hypothetical protein